MGRIKSIKTVIQNDIFNTNKWAIGESPPFMHWEKLDSEGCVAQIWGDCTSV